MRARLLGLARARGADFQTLPVFLILAQQLRLDLEVIGAAPSPTKETGPDLQQEVLDTLRRHHAALTQYQLRCALIQGASTPPSDMSSYDVETDPEEDDDAR